MIFAGRTLNIFLNFIIIYKSSIVGDGGGGEGCHNLVYVLSIIISNNMIAIIGQYCCNFDSVAPIVILMDI